MGTRAGSPGSRVLGGTHPCALSQQMGTCPLEGLRTLRAARSAPPLQLPQLPACHLPPATCLMPHCHQGLSGRKGTQPRGYPEHAALGLPQSQPSLNADDCCFS